MNKKALTLSALGVGTIAGVIFIYWLLVGRFSEYTDDAYVHGNMVQITPQVSAVVTAINFDDTDFVKKDQVIVELDKTDYLFSLKAAEATLGERVRQVTQLFIRQNQLAATVEAKKAGLARAEFDYQNRKELVGIGGVSKEDFEHAETTLLESNADLRATELALEELRAEIVGTTVATHPLVEEAVASLKEAWVNLKRCEVVAPVDGYVAKRSVQLGERVESSEPLLMVIPLDELWVDANFKEVKVGRIRIGQSAEIESDIYGSSVKFHGKVVGINPGTGSVFSALPPQNATGNWIKILQRVPVRISLDPDELKAHPLWLGLSMNVTVDVRHTEGRMLAQATPERSIYSTDVYRKQQEGIDFLVRRIIEENSE